MSRRGRRIETHIDWDWRQWVVALLVNGHAVVDMALGE